MIEYTVKSAYHQNIIDTVRVVSRVRSFFIGFSVINKDLRQFSPWSESMKARLESIFIKNLIFVSLSFVLIVCVHQSFFADAALLRKYSK